MDVEFYNWMSDQKSKGMLEDEFIERAVKSKTLMRIMFIGFVDENDDYFCDWIKGQLVELKQAFEEGKE